MMDLHCHLLLPSTTGPRRCRPAQLLIECPLGQNAGDFKLLMLRTLQRRGHRIVWLTASAPRSCGVTRRVCPRSSPRDAQLQGMLSSSAAGSIVGVFGREVLRFAVALAQAGSCTTSRRTPVMQFIGLGTRRSPSRPRAAARPSSCCVWLDGAGHPAGDFAGRPAASPASRVGAPRPRSVGAWAGRFRSGVRSRPAMRRPGESPEADTAGKGHLPAPREPAPPLIRGRDFRVRCKGRDSSFVGDYGMFTFVRHARWRVLRLRGGSH